MKTDRRIARLVTRAGGRANMRGGFSLIEIMAVVTITGVLISFAAPSFRRAVEQSRADIAGANLRAIWTAQRLYWLEYHKYTENLDELVSLELLDPSLVSATSVYVYS